jgi:hypothetical protein
MDTIYIVVGAIGLMAFVRLMFFIFGKKSVDNTVEANKHEELEKPKTTEVLESLAHAKPIKGKPKEKTPLISPAPQKKTVAKKTATKTATKKTTRKKRGGRKPKAQN